MITEFKYLNEFVLEPLYNKMVQSKNYTHYCGNSEICLSTGPNIGSFWCISKPLLIPLCLIALLIGLFTSFKLYFNIPTKKFQPKLSQLIYTTTFFLYGVMMTSAMILHCFIPKTDKFKILILIFETIDCGLTSNIAIGFMLAGLNDLTLYYPIFKKIRIFLNVKHRIGSFIGFIFILAIVLFIWFFSLVINWKYLFLVMYLGVVSICCLIYVITQIIIFVKILLSKQKSQIGVWKSLSAFVFGGLFGAIGLGSISVLMNMICHIEGIILNGWIGPEFIWFLCSDISVLLIFYYIYFLKTEVETKFISLHQKKKSEFDEFADDSLNNENVLNIDDDLNIDNDQQIEGKNHHEQDQGAYFGLEEEEENNDENNGIIENPDFELEQKDNQGEIENVYL